MLFEEIAMSRLPNLALGVDRRAGVGRMNGKEASLFAVDSKVGQSEPDQFKFYCCWGIRILSNGDAIFGCWPC